jgi:hypothetical protein
MSSVENTFEILTERKPTDRERHTLYKMRDALGIKNNDAIWQILVVLEYYRSMYESIPEQIIDSAEQLLKGVKQNADKIIQSSMETYKADFSKSAITIVQSIARKVVTKNLIQWVCFLLFIVAMIIGTTIYITYEKAFINGVIIGNTEAHKYIKNENYKIEWGNSEEGTMAHEVAATGNLRKIYEMSKDDSLNFALKLYDQGLLPHIAVMYYNDNIMQLINCTGKGWKIENDICIPYSYKDENNISKIHGWKIK